MCISIYATPANTQCIAYKSGATNKNVNSIGSVIPVTAEVKAADNKSPPTTFLFPGFAHYIARAAPGKPNIISGNLPAINLVAETLNLVIPGVASSAKNIF